MVERTDYSRGNLKIKTDWRKVQRGKSKLQAGDEDRRNRGEKETKNLKEAEKVATGKFGCEMKGGKWRRKRELCRGGRVNGERSISPWMMRERLTLPGQI